MIENLSTLIPVVAVTSAVSGFLGWSMRAPSKKAVHPAKSSPAADSGKQERVKNLEAALEKSRASHKETKHELEALQAGSVSKSTLDATAAELDAARKELDGVGKRISSLEADLKKSQETIKTLNSRANEVDKAQKDRSFALENELSKTREQLALLQNRPDDSAELQAEIERLRESVATSTRFAGELRKRESTAIEALEKAEARLATALETGRDLPAPSKKIGPVVDSGRIAAAKAEVIRLVELNKQKAAAPAEANIPTAQSNIPTAEADIPTAESDISTAESDIAPAEPIIAPAEPDITPAEPNIAPAEPIVAPADPDIAPETTSAQVERKLPKSGELFALD
ncbi:MAG: hypothetical protein V4584_11365 [Verrucomicrobiota bacterium]